MIINNFKESNLIMTGKIMDSMDMSMDAANTMHLMMLLSTNLYSDAISSVVREYSTNAIDSVIQSGKKTPIVISIQKDKTNKYYFEVQDNGLGLSDLDFNNIMSKYGASTKRDSNEVLGMFGLGSKSAYAVTDTFFYDCYKDGKRRKYLMYKGELGFKIDLLLEENTTKENGVIVRIPINSNYDVNKYKSAVKQQLRFFDNVYFNIGEEINNFKIYTEKDFQWSTLHSNSELSLSIGKVNYEINWLALGISTIYLPVSLKFDIGDGIFPNPSREMIVMTKETKQLILNKIKLVSEWFITKYNENVKSFDTLLKAWNYINVTTKTITIEGKDFEISSLQQFSDVKFSEPKVKGISLINPNRYKTLAIHLVKGYNSVGRIEHGGRMSNSGKSEDGLIREHLEGRRTLLINNNLSGHFREYVKTLGYKHFVRTDKINDDLKYYEQILTLADYSKDKWEDVIKEWKTIKERFCNELFTDGTNYHISQDFLDYKEANKTTSSYVATSSYKRLNKVSGQVVINHYVDSRRRNELKLDRYTENINALYKKPYLTLVFDDENKDECRDYTKSFQNLKNIKFIVLGKNDYKTISSLNIKNVKMFAKTKSKEIRLFKQMATAHLFQDVVEKFDDIKINAKGVIMDIFPELENSRHVLNKYVKMFNTVDGAIAKDIIAKAKESNDFDFTHWAEYKQIEEATKQLDFLRFVSYDYRTQSKEEFAAFINQFLLTRKMMGKLTLDNLEICVIPKKEEEIVELVKEEYENN